MQRVRTSLPYFEKFGWEAAVVAVDPAFSDMGTDGLLSDSLPKNLKIYYVKALNKELTGKVGLGSIALRALCYYRQKVNQILNAEKYDLIYFSTTQFPVCILGAYWKKRFHIPYVIDMQDPWHSEYYQNKPKSEQPAKYWFSYRLNKLLEPIGVKRADGLISVSPQYITDLKSRYPAIKDIPSATITFGIFEQDTTIAAKHKDEFPKLLNRDFINVVYVGRGGHDMHRAITPVFEALKRGLTDEPKLFDKLNFYFIGTSYAPAGKGEASILPLAEKMGVAQRVIEITDRISYYHTLATLQLADALFIPGSDDPNYTASKIYPYLFTKKPLLAVFNTASSAVHILRECTENAVVITFSEQKDVLEKQLYPVLKQWAEKDFKPLILSETFQKYSSETLTQKQTDLFSRALHYNAATNSNA